MEVWQLSWGESNLSSIESLIICILTHIVVFFFCVFVVYLLHFLYLCSIVGSVSYGISVFNGASYVTFYDVSHGFSCGAYHLLLNCCWGGTIALVMVLLKFCSWCCTLVMLFGCCLKCCSTLFGIIQCYLWLLKCYSWFKCYLWLLKCYSWLKCYLWLLGCW
jgi:hypothetical protein